jgi:hypothetical protein
MNPVAARAPRPALSPNFPQPDSHLTAAQGTLVLIRTKSFKCSNSDAFSGACELTAEQRQPRRGELKPHFRFAGGVWSCQTHEIEQHEFLTRPVVLWTIGCGYTVSEARAEWQRQRGGAQ